MEMWSAVFSFFIPESVLIIHLFLKRTKIITISSCMSGYIHLNIKMDILMVYYEK